MKKHVLLAICALFVISCANKKNTTDTSKPSPQAELTLAPGYIQADLKILNIEDDGEQKIISSEVIDILNYGSSTDPVPKGTYLKFTIDKGLYNSSSSKFKSNGTLTAILSNQGGGMMMGGQEKSNLWKLITINN